jgi:hypothetical protein
MRHHGGLRSVAVRQIVLHGAARPSGDFLVLKMKQLSEWDRNKINSPRCFLWQKFQAIGAMFNVEPTRALRFGPYARDDESEAATGVLLERNLEAGGVIRPAARGL